MGRQHIGKKDAVRGQEVDVSAVASERNSGAKEDSSIKRLGTPQVLYSEPD
jgi:hypothetical protein